MPRKPLDVEVQFEFNADDLDRAIGLLQAGLAPFTAARVHENAMSLLGKLRDVSNRSPVEDDHDVFLFHTRREE
jgi:hypothetical protein